MCLHKVPHSASRSPARVSQRRFRHACSPPVGISAMFGIWKSAHKLNPNTTRVLPLHLDRLRRRHGKREFLAKEKLGRYYESYPLYFLLWWLQRSGKPDEPSSARSPRFTFTLAAHRHVELVSFPARTLETPKLKKHHESPPTLWC